LYGVLALVNEPITHLFEQSIVATFMFVQVGTNWIRESAIKIKTFIIVDAALGSVPAAQGVMPPLAVPKFAGCTDTR
jgi:hypothetical protein